MARQELEALQEEDRMTPDLVFRDPYLLDFLGLEDTYCEKDLEAAILRELGKFLLQLGTDFSFIARLSLAVHASKAKSKPDLFRKLSISL